MVRPSQRKEIAKWLCKEHGVSIRLACQCASNSESCFRYAAVLTGDNALIADWLLRLTQTHKTWGLGLCYLYLLNVKNYSWNHKRVYRIYRELELNLRIKPRRRLKRDKPDTLGSTTAINQVWSMDFMRPALRSYSLAEGRLLRTFNVIDD